MKKLILLFFHLFVFVFSNFGYAQCPFVNDYYGVVEPSCPGITTVGCLVGGSYIQVVVIAGNTYNFSTCNGSWDSEITLYENTGTTVLGYDNDGCSLQSIVSYTATYTGYLNVLINLYPCEFFFECIDLDIECIGEPMPPSPTGDCVNAINVCTDLSFSVQSSGFGFINEIPALGTVGNPEYYAYDSILTPWGSDHYGCLMSGELNTTWMIINILTNGNLEFTFGANNTQEGFYDWIMYPYTSETCNAIPTGNFPPIRCNWNYQPFGGTGLASVIPPGGDSANFEPPLHVQAGERYIICMSNWSSVFTSVPLQFSGTSVVSCTPLPIELLKFSGHRHPEGDNHLEWTTASETNNDYFIVQRSINCVNWEELATKPGAGNSSSILNYNIHDYSPANSINYYRLIQVDFDGHSVPYKVVAIDNTTEKSKIIKITNLMGQEVLQDYKGIQFIFYSDGNVVKKSNCF